MARARSASLRPVDPGAQALRLFGAAGLLFAGAGSIVSGLLTWLRVPTDTGGVTLVSGWGAMSGGTYDGNNLNDLIDGYGSFRPAFWPTLLGALLMVLAIILAVSAVRAQSAEARRPARGSSLRAGRLVAVVGIVISVLSLAWAAFRLLRPDSSGALESGDGSAGPGQWVALACALVAGVSAGLCWWSTPAGSAPAPARAGIQP